MLEVKTKLATNVVLLMLISIPLIVVVTVEFDPTTYTVTESEGVVMFQIVKRTMTTQPVSVLFSTSPGTATGNRSCIDVLYN